MLKHHLQILIKKYDSKCTILFGGLRITEEDIRVTHLKKFLALFHDHILVTFENFCEYLKTEGAKPSELFNEAYFQNKKDKSLFLFSAFKNPEPVLGSMISIKGQEKKYNIKTVASDAGDCKGLVATSGIFRINEIVLRKSVVPYLSFKDKVCAAQACKTWMPLFAPQKPDYRYEAVLHSRNLPVPTAGDIKDDTNLSLLPPLVLSNGNIVMFPQFSINVYAAKSFELLAQFPHQDHIIFALEQSTPAILEGETILAIGFINDGIKIKPLILQWSAIAPITQECPVNCTKENFLQAFTDKNGSVGVMIKTGWGLPMVDIFALAQSKDRLEPHITYHHQQTLKVSNKFTLLQNFIHPTPKPLMMYDPGSVLLESYGLEIRFPQTLQNYPCPHAMQLLRTPPACHYLSVWFAKRYFKTGSMTYLTISVTTADGAKPRTTAINLLRFNPKTYAIHNYPLPISPAISYPFAAVAFVAVTRSLTDHSHFIKHAKSYNLPATTYIAIIDLSTMSCQQILTYDNGEEVLGDPFTLTWIQEDTLMAVNCRNQVTTWQFSHAKPKFSLETACADKANDEAIEILKQLRQESADQKETQNEIQIKLFQYVETLTPDCKGLPPAFKFSFEQRYIQDCILLSAINPEIGKPFMKLPECDLLKKDDKQLDEFLKTLAYAKSKIFLKILQTLKDPNTFAGSLYHCPNDIKPDSSIALRWQKILALENDFIPEESTAPKPL